ncbi:hypothetical protein A5721_18840 [Mycobacterium vulneris]|nr:hypothetical protein A5721_18840 [Mycolicibacterium vulneris]
MTANPVARHHALIDDMLANINRRSGISLPRGIDLTLHRTPTERVGAARYQAFFDAHANDPSPWSIEDMLPDYVLADRAILRWPSAWVHVIPDTRDIENNLRDRLAAIPIPPNPIFMWNALHTRDDDPPPWMRAHREALGLPVDDRPTPDTGARGDLVLLILSMIALGAIAAGIVLGVIR